MLGQLPRTGAVDVVADGVPLDGFELSQRGPIRTSSRSASTRSGSWSASNEHGESSGSPAGRSRRRRSARAATGASRRGRSRPRGCSLEVPSAASSTPSCAMKRWKPAEIGGRRPGRGPARPRRPSRRRSRAVGVDALEGRDVRVAPDAADRAAVGGELLPARDRGGDAQERAAVPDERLAGQPRRPPVLLVLVGAERRDGAADRLAGAVDPRAQARVAAAVVAELVRQHAAELPFGEDVQERQAEQQHAPAARDLGDGRVVVEREVDVVGHRLAARVAPPPRSARTAAAAARGDPSARARRTAAGAGRSRAGSRPPSTRLPNEMKMLLRPGDEPREDGERQQAHAEREREHVEADRESDRGGEAAGQ